MSVAARLFPLGLLAILTSSSPGCQRIERIRVSIRNGDVYFENCGRTSCNETWPSRRFFVASADPGPDQGKVLWSFFGSRSAQPVRYGGLEDGGNALRHGGRYRINDCYFTLSSDGNAVAMETGAGSSGCYVE